MKSQEELNALKNEVEALNAKLTELTDEEMALVAGGSEHTYWIIGGMQMSPEAKPVNSPETDENILQTYKKDIGSDKNAKVIF